MPIRKRWSPYRFVFNCNTTSLRLSTAIHSVSDYLQYTQSQTTVGGWSRSTYCWWLVTEHLLLVVGHGALTVGGWSRSTYCWWLVSSPECSLLPAARCVDQERLFVFAQAVEIGRVQTERPLYKLIGEDQWRTN